MRDILSLVGEIMKAIVIYNSYVSFRLIYGYGNIYVYEEFHRLFREEKGMRLKDGEKFHAVLEFFGNLGQYFDGVSRQCHRC